MMDWAQFLKLSLVLIVVVFVVYYIKMSTEHFDANVPAQLNSVDNAAGIDTTQTSMMTQSASAMGTTSSQQELLNQLSAELKTADTLTPNLKQKIAEVQFIKPGNLQAINTGLGNRAFVTDFRGPVYTEKKEVGPFGKNTTEFDPMQPRWQLTN
jgi:hypothetical protein